MTSEARRLVRRRLAELVSASVPLGPAAYFLGLGLLVFLPLLGDGYLLTLDMVFSPNTAYVDYLFRSTDPLYYGRLPVAALLDVVALVVPDWAIQRVILVGIVAGSGLSMYRASRAQSYLGALFAGTLFAINPFVYVRALAGHWWFLLGYALLPMAVASYADAITGRGGARRAAGWATAASVFDPHVAVLLAVAYVPLGAVALVRSADGSVEGRRVVERTGRVAAIAVALNAYWLLPAVAAVLAGRSKVAAMTGLDLVAFSAAGTLDGNVPLSVATLLGFWRGGTRLPVPGIPLPAWIGLFSVLLLLAFAGWYCRREDPFFDGTLAIGVVGFVLALGVSVDSTAPLFRALYEHAVVFRGMRDSQKFVALLALAYAALAGPGVDVVVGWIEGVVEATGLGSRDSVPAVESHLPARRTVLRGALALLLLATPLAYTWPMLWGFSGQLSTTDYPEGWAEADDHLVADAGEYRVLFLPWHQYLTFPWTDGLVVTPADTYFQRPVIRSRSIDLVGIDAQAASPAHERVAALLDDPDAGDGTGPELAALGVKYVVVTDATGSRTFDDLHLDDDFAVALENDDLVVYENRAFAGAPPPGRWPRARPVVPWGSLFGGAVVSIVAVVVVFGRRPRGGSWRDRFEALG